MKAETADLSTDAPVAPLADSPPDSIEPETAEPEPVSLAALVDATPMPATIDPELRCLAGAVSFASPGESPTGPLSVALEIRRQSGWERVCQVRVFFRVSRTLTKKKIYNYEV